MVNFVNSTVPRSGSSAYITRLSDSSIAVSWEPLTLEEACGLLPDTQSHLGKGKGEALGQSQQDLVL